MTQRCFTYQYQDHCKDLPIKLCQFVFICATFDQSTYNEGIKNVTFYQIQMVCETSLPGILSPWFLYCKSHKAGKVNSQQFSLSISMGQWYHYLSVSSRFTAIKGSMELKVLSQKGKSREVIFKSGIFFKPCPLMHRHAPNEIRLQRMDGNRWSKMSRVGVYYQLSHRGRPQWQIQIPLQLRLAQPTVAVHGLECTPVQMSSKFLRRIVV